MILSKESIIVSWVIGCLFGFQAGFLGHWPTLDSKLGSTLGTTAPPPDRSALLCISAINRCFRYRRRLQIALLNIAVRRAATDAPIKNPPGRVVCFSLVRLGTPLVENFGDFVGF